MTVVSVQIAYITLSPHIMGISRFKDFIEHYPPAYICYGKPGIPKSCFYAVELCCVTMHDQTSQKLNVQVIEFDTSCFNDLLSNSPCARLESHLKFMSSRYGFQFSEGIEQRELTPLIQSYLADQKFILYNGNCLLFHVLTSLAATDESLVCHTNFNDSEKVLSMVENCKNNMTITCSQHTLNNSHCCIHEALMLICQRILTLKRKRFIHSQEISLPHC